MKELEAESILFARSLDELTGAEDDGPDPVAGLCLLRLVEQQQPGLENTPQLGPALEAASDLKIEDRRMSISHLTLKRPLRERELTLSQSARTIILSSLKVERSSLATRFFCIL